MRSRQLSQLRNDALWLLDQQGAQTPSVTDLNDRINQGIAEIFSILMRTSETAYFRKSTTVSLASGQSVYPLPVDFYELLAVELMLDTNNTVILTSFTNIDRPYLASTTPGWSGEPVKYQIQGKTSYTDTGSIEFLPIPGSGLNVTLRYVWAPTPLVLDTDTFDGIAGFEDYAVLHTVYRCAIKFRDYQTADRLLNEMSRVEARIVSLAKGRDAFMPPKVAMTRDLWRPRFSRTSR